jgi:hypothetical protein
LSLSADGLCQKEFDTKPRQYETWSTSFFNCRRIWRLAKIEIIPRIINLPVSVLKKDARHFIPDENACENMPKQEWENEK